MRNALRFLPFTLSFAGIFSLGHAGTPAPAADDDYAVQNVFSSELHPKAALWFTSPVPESEWRYKMSAQTPLWLTKEDPASKLLTINVDSTKTYQPMLGMGTSLEETSVYAMAKNHTDAQIKDILKTLIDPSAGIGMDLFRLTIGTSDFADGRAVTSNPKGFYSYQDDQEAGFSIENDRKLNILRVIKLTMEVAAEMHQPIKFFASAWSPPGWMKDNGSLIGGKLKTDMIPAYAEYLRKFVQAYEAEGIPIYAITTNNEHYFAPNQYPGCYFDATQEKLLVEALGHEFGQSGLKTKVWIVDHNFALWKEAQKTFLGLQADGPANYAASDGTAFHHYGGVPAGMTRLHDAFPDKSIQFTEGAKWGTKGADEMVQLFRNWSQSYVSWVTMVTEHPEEHIQGTYNKPPALSPVLLVKKDGAGPEWYKIPEYYIYGQFMKFIRPGAVRIDSDAGSADTATNVAFKNPDGTIVIVAVNQNLWVQDLRFVVDGNQFVATIPAATVATYTLKSGLNPSTLAPAGLPEVGLRTLPPTGSGSALAEWWFDLKGGKSLEAHFEGDPRFPDNPTGSKVIPSLKTNDQWKDGSGTRMRGFIHPNASGAYVFYVSGDSSAELYLSTDDLPSNKKLIARCPTWAGSFDKHPEQKSMPIQLENGKKYYFETFQVGGGGNGRTDVAWDVPGIANGQVIEGKFLSPP